MRTCFSRLAALAALVLALGACSPYAGPAEQTGTATGTIVGAVVGSTIGHGPGRLAATLIGATAGGLIGNRIGNSIDKDAEKRAMEAERFALENSPPGEPYGWEQGEYTGSVQAGPPRPYRGYGRCREVTHTIQVDGKPQTATGIACRSPDGSWRSVG